MSTRKPRQGSISDSAGARGRAAYSRAHGRAPNRSGGRIARSLAGGLADLGTQHAPDAVDFAGELAALMVRTAVTLADGVLDAAEEFDSLLRGSPRESHRGEPPAAGDGGLAAYAPPNLRLPDASPGAETKADFVVRNSGLDTIDAMGLRCSGLMASGGSRIPGSSVKFEPGAVEVPPKSAAGVTCTVRVPARTKRGHYVGLIEATDRPEVRLLVALDVV